MSDFAPPSWLDEAPPIDAVPEWAGGAGEGNRALAAPTAPPSALAAVSDRTGDAFKRDGPAGGEPQTAKVQPLRSVPAAASRQTPSVPGMRTMQEEGPTTNIAQIMGVERFDLELEAWLTARHWHLKLNLLSGEQELHRPSGVVRMTDERLSEARFSFSYASNGKEPAKDKMADAFGLIAERRAYHPVLDYLDGLTWDGIPRIDGWLSYYAGAEDTALNRAFSRKVLCAAVRRVRSPGCKFDHILTLQGPQGIKKSALIRGLCPDGLWFTDQVTVGSPAKETMENASGSWIVEMAELDGMNRRDAGRIKSFITTTRDKARLAYGRYATDRPRQFILFGTTNEKDFLRDLTGNRRWWIVRVGSIDIDALVADRDQLWAEAALAEPSENLWLDTPELNSAADEIATNAVDRGAWFNLLAGKVPDGPMMLSCRDAWEMVGITADAVHKVSSAHGDSLKRALVGLGFDPVPKNRRRFGKQTPCYVRGGDDAQWWSPSDPAPKAGQGHPDDF